jgi:hypothetical protein
VPGIFRERGTAMPLAIDLVDAFLFGSVVHRGLLGRHLPKRPARKLEDSQTRVE